ncbi:hypothetical protein F383_24753 [Gossypium arboreum]|uniref:Uncharacterized protein n=1 Tax=Gossypium arboreum TaxID=29729 RepID=A0A0B0P3S1_GOSAR|nr:hypothetical protein F383_24753 [Gossypium arboreum]
MRPINLYT